VRPRPGDPGRYENGIDGHRVGLVQPNETTRVAVGHPVAYALLTALVCGVIAGAAFAASGPASGIGGGVGAFVIVFLLGLWLWSKNGPGARWYQRRSETG
jgi:hypothetical protein